MIFFGIRATIRTKIVVSHMQKKKKKEKEEEEKIKTDLSNTETSSYFLYIFANDKNGWLCYLFLHILTFLFLLYITMLQVVG